jgi:hypothetical protein
MRHLIMAAMIGLSAMHGAHHQTVRSCAGHLVTAMDNGRPFAPALRHDCWQLDWRRQRQAETLAAHLTS